MPDDMGPLNVKMVFDATKARVEESNQDASQKRREGHKEKQDQKTAKDFFHTITKAAERSNEILKSRGKPYRFDIHLENEQVFINLVRLDAKGNTIESVRKNIAYEDFSRWIEDVSQIEGLFYDHSA
jgi:hypothetical protein